MMKKSTKTVNQYGDVFWKNQDGEYHREDGPAIEYADGTKAWFINGKYHREDGLVVEWSNGNKKWYLNDIEYSEEEYNIFKRDMYEIFDGVVIGETSYDTAISMLTKIFKRHLD